MRRKLNMNMKMKKMKNRLAGRPGVIDDGQDKAEEEYEEKRRTNDQLNAMTSRSLERFQKLEESA